MATIRETIKIKVGDQVIEHEEVIRFDVDDFIDELTDDDLKNELEHRGFDFLEEAKEDDLKSALEDLGYKCYDKPMSMDELIEAATDNLHSYYRLKAALELYSKFSLADLERAKEYLEETSMKVTGLNFKKIG
jgi:hypothetical protein